MCTILLLVCTVGWTLLGLQKEMLCHLQLPLLVIFFLWSHRGIVLETTFYLVMGIWKKKPWNTASRIFQERLFPPKTNTVVWQKGDRGYRSFTALSEYGEKRSAASRFLSHPAAGITPAIQGVDSSSRNPITAALSILIPGLFKPELGLCTLVVRAHGWVKRRVLKES